jgi:hypothetical protein
MLMAVVAILGMSQGVASASAAGSAHRYPLKRGAHCRHSFKRVKRDGREYCVKSKAPRKKKATPSSPAPVQAPATGVGSSSPSASPLPAVTKIALHAHLDPDLARYNSNPFEVGYGISAAANEQIFSAESGALTGEPSVAVPPGVLTLSSDGKLECSFDVGSTNHDRVCFVEYENLGLHTVTVSFTSEGQSVSETVTENIQPLLAKAVLGLSYTPRPEPEAIEPGLWVIGSLSVNFSPPGNRAFARLGCETAGNNREITSDGCYELEFTNELSVYATAIGSCSAPEIGDISLGEPQWPTFRGPPMSPSNIESGAFHLRATVSQFGGYAESETITPLQFKPAATLPPDC